MSIDNEPPCGEKIAQRPNTHISTRPAQFLLTLQEGERRFRRRLPPWSQSSREQMFPSSRATNSRRTITLPPAYRPAPPAACALPRQSLPRLTGHHIADRMPTPQALRPHIAGTSFE